MLEHIMRPLGALALVGVTVALVAASQGAAATPQQTTSVYVVGSLTVPGVDTGLVLRKGHPVTVSATGTVCPGTGFCTTPDGTWVVDTTESPYDGYVLPGAPAYGLVARVGTGPWVQVGTGPVQIKGKGDLVFAFNDDKFLQSGTVLPWVSVPTGEWAETQATFRFLVNDFFGGVEADGNDADFDLRDAYNYAGALREVFDLGAARYLWLGYRFDQEDPVGDTDTGSQAFAYDGHQVETGFSWTLPSAYGMEGGYSYRYELYDNASREPTATGDPTLPQRRDNIHGVYFLLHIPLPAFFDPVNFEMTCGVLSTFNNSNQTAFDYERLVGLISVTARL